MSVTPPLAALPAQPGPLAQQLAIHEATLAGAGVATPRVDVRLLAQHALGAEVLRGGRDADVASMARLDEWVSRRAQRVPLQLLVGGTGFRLLDVACVEGVFVPRPETEIVAGLAIEIASSQQRPRIVEPCTGTGAIALSLAAEVPSADVVATDLSSAAVAQARHNLRRLVAGGAGPSGLAAGAFCQILQGDLLDPVDTSWRGHVDVLVSNPPYLPLSDRDALPAEVIAHDPAAALFGGVDGHEIVARLVTEAASWLRPGGAVVIEIDERRTDHAVGLARDAGLVDVRVEADLTGADRVLVARRGGRP